MGLTSEMFGIVADTAMKRMEFIPSPLLWTERDNDDCIVFILLTMASTVAPLQGSFNW